MSQTKIFSSEIAKRYALALYDLSKEDNQIDEYSSKIVTFMNLYNSNENLRFFIKNPTYSVEDQRIIFDKIFNYLNFNKILKNFFSILILKKRIFFLDKIMEKFISLISIRKGEISANLISSKKLDDKLVADLENEMSSNINKKIRLKCKVDESLIGGIVLQIGSLMIDTSVKNKLQKYKKLMLEV